MFRFLAFFLWNDHRPGFHRPHSLTRNGPNFFF